jgi:hypothetical protein
MDPRGGAIQMRSLIMYKSSMYPDIIPPVIECEETIEVPADFGQCGAGFI